MNRMVLMFLKNIHRIPGKVWKLRRHAKHPERYPEIERWRHVQSIMQMLVKAGNVELQVFGTENIPEKGFMLYGNHQSLFDVMAVASSCDSPLGAVYKKELKNTPMLRHVYGSTKSFAMDREDVRQSLTVINQVIDEVKSGRSYLIFPEGTRSKLGNQMLPFHGGSFRCAVKAKCPVVPMVLIDSYKVFEEKNNQPVTVQIHYLPPIPYEEFQDLKAAQLAELVKARIQECIDTHT